MRLILKKYVLLLCFIIIIYGTSTVHGAISESPKLQVIQSSISFVQHNSVTYVTSIGKIKNNTDYNISDIVLEAQFFDGQKNLIDVASENLYYVNVSPHDEIAFKLQTTAATRNDDYSSQSVRVIGMTEEKPCTSSGTNQSRSKKNVWLNMLINWFPLLLLLALWMLFMRRYAGKNSPQHKTINLIEEQNSLFTHQNKLLERIAYAVEGRTKNDNNT
jgi:ATP-dependent Zn protease